MTTPHPDTHQAHEVLSANQRFYEAIAGVYDAVDSRRNAGEEHRWVTDILAREREALIQRQGRPAASLRLVDAGAGSGFLGVRASELFQQPILVDISPAMLRRIALPGALKLAADCAHLPLANASVDMVGAFATLHHLHSVEPFFEEALRVLRPGGVLYCDHDIEAGFVRRFGLPLRAYRLCFDHGRDYLRACPSATQRDYELSEFHGGRGLSGPTLVAALERIGFGAVTATYHWEGMGLPATLLEHLGLKRLASRRGFAPILRLIARKAS